MDDDNKDFDDNDNDGNHDDDDNDDSVNVDSGHFNQLHWGRQQSDLIHTSYLSFFLHGQNFWRIKFTPKNANFSR